MPKEWMSPRERWEAAIRRGRPDRIPLDYWATAEASRKLMDYLGLADMDQVYTRLHIDRPVFVGPAYTGPTPAPGRNYWGVEHRTIDYGTGSYAEAVSSPLAGYETVAQIEADYTWPTIDWFDFSGIAGQAAGQEHRPIQGGGSEPLLVYKQLRGEAQAFMDFIERPDLMRYILDKLFGLAYETTARIYRAIPGQVLITYVAEDMGAQDGLMYSPAHIREFLLPWMRRMADLVHENGAYVFHHNDGACRAILPDMVDTVGIDVLNPIQWRCAGMAREGLKADFGDRLAFHGAVDNQYTIPFGTVDEVRAEVADDMAILGAGGGYILAPCHNIQSVGPAENVVALYDAAYEGGWY
jgi:uroporphyrinogen decarboxylase